MNREVLIACSPYLIAMLVAIMMLWLLVRLSGARLRLAHVRTLHRDQQGAVQSLSFVLTLPLFVMILMFIVQLSQITIGTVVVEYAAFAAARAAMVWIPAETANEFANQIGTYRQTSSGSSDTNGNSYAVYIVDPSGLKYQKIQFAAAMACMPIAPSRQTQTSASHPGMEAHSSLLNAYLSVSPDSAGNAQISTRLRRKLAYALNHTRVDIEVHHPLRVELGADAPLERYPLLDRDMYPPEFLGNEYGWQDQLYVTVSHDFALLPGPGRLLARRADARPGSSPESDPGTDRIARSLNKSGDVYVRTLTATVRLNNEGQKSSLPFYQTLRGNQAPNLPASDFSASGERGESAANGQGTGEGDGEENEQGAGCCGNEAPNGEDGREGVGEDRNEGEDRDRNEGDNDREGQDARDGEGEQDGREGQEGPNDRVGPDGQGEREGERDGEGRDRPNEAERDGPGRERQPGENQERPDSETPQGKQNSPDVDRPTERKENQEGGADR